MSTEDVAAPVSGSWSPLTTAVVAVRSAVSAIALIAVFDRQFIVSKWLHWALQNWAELLGVVLSFIPYHIPEPNRPFFAFTLIMLGTVLFDAAIRWRQPTETRSDSLYFIFVGRFQKPMWVGVIFLLLLWGLGFAFNKKEPERIFDAIPLSGFEQWVLYLLAFSLLVSPRMFLWLASFTAAFIGLNEIALLFEQNVPLPPS